MTVEGSDCGRARAVARGGLRGTAVAVAVAGLVLAACSSSSTPSSQGGSTTSSGTSAGSSGYGSASSGASGGASIDSLTASLKKGEQATYLATYLQTTGGSSQNWTVAQAPPKSRFTTPDGSVIDTGSQTLFCSTSSGSTTCVATSGSSPLASLTALFDPRSVISVLDTFAGRVASRIAGISVTQSSKTIAGQASQCVSISSGGSSAGTWCANSAGVVTEVQASTGGGLTMTAYTTDVPGSTFEVPAGATVQTIPSIG